MVKEPDIKKYQKGTNNFKKHQKYTKLLKKKNFKESKI